MNSIIVRGGTVDIPLSLLSRGELEADVVALSCVNPAYLEAQRAEDPSAWRFPKLISSLVVENGFARYPIARPDVYRPRLRDAKIEDKRPRTDPKPLEYRGALEDFQRAAVEALVARSCGTDTGRCGAGKGELVIAIAGRIGLPTLVIVPTIDLARDLVERIRVRLGFEAGMLGGGEHRIARITVAVAASLDTETVEELGSVECVLVDECHHAAAQGLRAALRNLRARKFFGFTATFVREDGLTFHRDHLGPVVHEITRADLVRAGRSVEPSYHAVATQFEFAYETREDWHPLLEALERDDDRNDLIVRLATREANAGELVAILVGRVAHAVALAKTLCARGLKAVALTGDMPKKARVASIENARAGRVDVIVGTSLLDEGIDIPRLSRVILAWPAKAEGRIVQRIGRALRVVEGKSPPAIFDIVDSRVGVLAFQARARRGIFNRNFGSLQRRAA